MHELSANTRFCVNYTHALAANTLAGTIYPHARSANTAERTIYLHADSANTIKRSIYPHARADDTDFRPINPEMGKLNQIIWGTSEDKGGGGRSVRETGDVIFADFFRQSFAGVRVQALPFFQRRVIRQRGGENERLPTALCGLFTFQNNFGNKICIERVD